MKMMKVDLSMRGGHEAPVVRCNLGQCVYGKGWSLYQAVVPVSMCSGCQLAEEPLTRRGRSKDTTTMLVTTEL